MKDIIGTRHKKVSITNVSSSKDDFHYIVNDEKPLQAFDVFAENGEQEPIVHNINKHSIKSKKHTIFKNKDWAKYKQESFDRDSDQRQCQNLSYNKFDESIETLRKPFDISQLHKCIEINNNDKYEIDCDATFDSFLSTDEVCNEEYQKRIRTLPSTSCRQKDYYNSNASFTSDNLFRISPGDEIRYSDPRNINIFASILHDHLDTLEKKKEKHVLDTTPPREERVFLNRKETLNGQVQQFKTSRSRTPDEKRISTSSLDRKHRGSTSPRAVTFKGGLGANSSESSENIERKISTGSDKNDTKLRSYSGSFSDAVQSGWRRIASQKQSSEVKKSTLDFVDFGACISPDAKKFANITDKLHTWAHRTNSKKSRHKRQFSLTDTFTDPKLTLQNSKRQQKKSSEHEKLSSSSEETILRKNKEIVSYDVSCEREIVRDEFLQDSDFFISSNVWYYGELDIALDFEKKNENGSSCSSEEDDIVVGSLIIVLDQNQNLFYSLTYCIGNKHHSATIPYESGKYSMDFSNPEQPRFSSMKYLIAYLIEQNYLLRVPFSWLLDRLSCTSESIECKSESDWCSDGSEIL